MATNKCGKCKREFSKPQYLVAHLNQKKNFLCFKYSLQCSGLSTNLQPNSAQRTSDELPTDANDTSERGADLEENELNNESFDCFDSLMVDNDDKDAEMAEDAPGLPAPPPEAPPTGAKDSDKLDQTDNIDKDLIRRWFADYAASSARNRAWMDPEYIAAIELMHTLTISGAPLGMFDALMKWHVAHKEAKKVVTRPNLMKTLRERYNMSSTEPYEVETWLPVSGVKVRIPCHDVLQMTMDLLTDPRIQEEDYLWHNGDPASPPPDEWLELRDINDGLAYRKTYDQLIRPNPYTESGRLKVLLPILLYMDSCVTGFNENLSLELVKFTFGIFTSKAREKEYTWRVAGAVPQYQSVKTAAAEGIETSSHVEAGGYVTPTDSDDEDGGNLRTFTHEFEFGDYINSDDEEEKMCDIAIPDTDAQDLHVILQVIMHGWKRIVRQGGFEWDLRHNNSLLKVHFVPFIAIIKGDTVEHDKHTGHYGARTRGVQSLCRYCICPAEETDMPYVDHEMKSPAMISRLVAKRDEDGLQKISQQFIFNVWYEFMFGLHDELGVHSATPMELLHWIQLGVYKYSRTSFFKQMGPESQLSKDFNVLASSMGWLFQRQSDRAFPRTKFTNGVQKGKLMAHEMTGMMLVLVAVLRSSRGSTLLLSDENSTKQAHFFPNQEAVNAWIKLLELQLMFESWLKLPNMSVNTVKRLRTKVREYLQMNKDVARRETGMGFKINNFHAALHVPGDILNFGPPHVVNTYSNETMHKPDKGSARRTQKRPKTFDIQSARQVDDRRVLEVGIQELKGRPRWDYYVSFQRTNQHKSDRIIEMEAKRGAGTGKAVITKPKLTGVFAKFGYKDDVFGVLAVNTAMKMKRKFVYPQVIVEALQEIKELVGDDLEVVEVYSELDMPNRQKYRASPHYFGKSWYDWALYRFPAVAEGYDEPIRPVHIRCFVDLTSLQPQNGSGYSPGVYFFGETVRLNPSMEEITMSSIFVPYQKLEGNHSTNKTELLDVSRIIGPVCVIPDLDNANSRAFLAVRPMADWSTMFEEWVNQPHLREHMETVIE